MPTPARPRCSANPGRPPVGTVPGGRPPRTGGRPTSSRSGPRSSRPRPRATGSTRCAGGSTPGGRSTLRHLPALGAAQLRRPGLGNAVDPLVTRVVDLDAGTLLSDPPRVGRLERRVRPRRDTVVLVNRRTTTHRRCVRRAPGRQPSPALECPAGSAEPRTTPAGLPGSPDLGHAGRMSRTVYYTAAASSLSLPDPP